MCKLTKVIERMRNKRAELEREVKELSGEYGVTAKVTQLNWNITCLDYGIKVRTEEYMLARATQLMEET